MSDMIDLILRTASREELAALLRDTEEQRQAAVGQRDRAVGLVQRMQTLLVGAKYHANDEGDSWWVPWLCRVEFATEDGKALLAEVAAEKAGKGGAK